MCACRGWTRVFFLAWKKSFLFLPSIEWKYTKPRSLPSQLRWHHFDWSISLVQILYSWSVGGGARAIRWRGDCSVSTRPWKEEEEVDEWQRTGATQRKRLFSFRAWNKDLGQTLRHCSIFNPSTLDTSLLTLSRCLWSRPSPPLPSPSPPPLSEHKQARPQVGVTQDIHPHTWALWQATADGFYSRYKYLQHV